MKGGGLKWEAWPTSDRVMWEHLVQSGDPFDDAGPWAHLRETTRKTLRYRYGRWLGWLAAFAPSALEEDPADRATMDRLSSWLECLPQLAPASREVFVDGCIRVLRTAMPQNDWSSQQRLLKALRGETARTSTTRKIGRVPSTTFLLDIGLHIAGPAAEMAGTPLEAAKRRRDGAIIALLAMLPMRRRSLLELTLGSSIRVARAGSTSCFPAI